MTLEEPSEEVTAEVNTPDECLAYVERVGICSWRRYEKLPGLPSLEEVTPWSGAELTYATWFWKDDLHIDRRLFYAPLLAPDAPAFVSLELLPYLIAAQGDNDPHTLFEKGRLASNALRVYEHVERHGPTATNALPWPKGSRMLYMAALQQRFLLTKHDLTGRTRGTYGYRWCLCEEAFPEAFTRAGRIAVSDARAHILTHLQTHGIADLTPTRVARLFRWSEE